ncbi:hypothetical protein H0H87_001344, partial [Tephrocybe sp. NHM501043]
IPSNISFESAATLPVGLASGLIGLYLPEPHGAGLVPPLEAAGRGKYKGAPFVVLGGASNVGQNGMQATFMAQPVIDMSLVIQLAKLSGFSPIITTASPHNGEYLKSIGATHVLDRNTPSSALIDQIHEIAAGPIGIVYDAVSFSDTQKLGFNLLGDVGSLILVHPPVEGIKGTASKRVINFQGFWTFPHTRALGIELYSKLTELLEKGLIKVRLLVGDKSEDSHLCAATAK